MKRILLVFISIIIIAIPNLNAQKLAEQDSLALVAFYYATDGPNWISNQDDFTFDIIKDGYDSYYRNNPGTGKKWLDGPVKNWFGIRVQEQLSEDGTQSVLRVVEISPILGRRENGQNKLKGYLPQEMGMLTALRTIRLDGNDGFAGSEIPDEIYHTTLERIDFERCGFEGGISDKIRECTNFKKFNLRYNPLYYIPTFDFISEENLRGGGTQWIYSTSISFEYIEPTIDYFYSLSPNPQEFAFEARDNTNVGVEREIVAQPGERVVLKITDAGSQGKVNWYKNGMSIWRTGEEYVIESLQESDYGNYMGRLENDYVKNYDTNPNYGPHDTKPIHLVKTPVAPVCVKAETANDGKSIILYFTKPMAQPTVADAGSFIVDGSSGNIAVESFLLFGEINDRIRLNLAEPLVKGENITISYNQGSVICSNGGALEAFSGLEVANYTREMPVIDSLVTTTDGKGILVSLDKFVDKNSLVANDFVVNDGSENSVVSVAISRGPVNNNISKTVLLTLAKPLNPDQTITLEYNQGSLKALYGGTLSSFAPLNVKNMVQENRAEVKITFTDGTKTYDNIVIAGNISTESQPMYDDGTNGDEITGDHTWTSVVTLADGEYYWEVLSRKQVTSNDTTITTDPETGATTIVITPVTESVDSLLSEGYNLNFNVENTFIAGTTHFGINDKEITFNLDLSNYSGEVTEVFLMGINEDWSEGLQMTHAGNNIYTITISPYSVGDYFEFNFRNGDVWENVSLSTRTYTVKDGENIANYVFSDFTTSLKDYESASISIFPNPAHTHITISGSEYVEKAEIINMIGQSIKLIHNDSNSNLLQINISELDNGFYLLKMQSNEGGIRTKQFIKR